MNRMLTIFRRRPVAALVRGPRMPRQVSARASTAQLTDAGARQPALFDTYAGRRLKIPFVFRLRSGSSTR